MSAITGVHPYADKFPMLPESELAELAESIKANGQRNPIVLTTDGLILDGRNRAKACELANLEPETVVYDGDDLAEYVIDCNTSRRHMSTGARAMSTALIMNEKGSRKYNDDGIGYWARGTLIGLGSDKEEARDEGIRKAFNRAGVVLDYKPNLAWPVVAGQVELTVAYEQAKAIKDSAERDKIMAREKAKREREQAKEEAERDARIVADLTQAEATYYLEQISDGHMKPVSAWAAYKAEHKKELDRLAAERKNDEQQVRMIGALLERIMFLEHKTQRDWCIEATAKYPDAMPEVHRQYHHPERIRELAGTLTTYADELEEARNV